MLEHLQDAPKTGKGKATEDCGNGLIWHEQGGPRYQESHNQPDPPATFAPVVLHLDNSRMADANADKNGSADYDTAEMHGL